MLSPADDQTPVILGLLLLAMIVALLLRALTRRHGQYAAFKLMTDTVERQGVYRRWLWQSFAINGGLSLVGLAAAWQFIQPLLSATGAWGWVGRPREALATANPIAVGVIVALGVLLAGFLVLPLVLLRSGDEVPKLGDIDALIPRNRAEIRWGWGLAVNAGVVEELLFRLAVPALLFGTTGSAVAAVIVSPLLFGLLHLYQGVVGVTTSIVLGAILLLLYLVTGSILAPMVLHALIDLRSLVVVPLALTRVRADAAPPDPAGPGGPAPSAE